MTVWDGYAHAGDTIRLTAFFFDGSGLLITGLSPTVDIAGSLTSALLVSDGAMTESVSMPGIYYYDYQTATAGTITYKVTSSAGEAIGSWIIGSGVLPSVSVTDYVAPDNAGILSIKAKTDNLPSDPASNTIVLTRLDSSDYIAPDNSGIASIKLKTDNLPIDPASNTQINTRLASSDFIAPDNVGIAGIKTKTDNLPFDPASNTQVNTRLASADFVAPDNAGITSIKSKTDNLPFDPASNSIVNTRLASSDYIAPDNSGIVAIKAKTDNLPLDPASDSTVNTRLSSSDYIASDNAGISAIKAKTDNLPSDFISPDNSGIAEILLYLETGISISETSIHAALDNWSPASDGYNFPIIYPPANSEDCRVYLWMGWLSAAEPPETIKSFAQITSAPYISSGRAFSGKEEGIYDAQSGIIYWDIVRGAAVNIKIIEYAVNIRFTVPDSAVYDLSQSLDS